MDWSLLARFSPVPEDGNLILTIDNDQVGTILINVFQIEPADQQHPLNDIEEAVESMGEVPGVVSFSLHHSLDGERVVSYVQFESRDVFESVQDSRDWEERIGDAMAAAEPDPHFLRGRTYT
ncbi:antibiotic biosynthesis monooxygenase [Natrinema sp. SYSU A 869]|uniref:antibiotic biosynthesis monooxygenase n=1 Tax=Natrinema sp. SYSU A 869 TaxID=2871694 RepID=UPI001CA44920|nr:antibiotic biosynthesis monooxygenase [Natrinema sp. SYSU A 869]